MPLRRIISIQKPMTYCLQRFGLRKLSSEQLSLKMDESVKHDIENSIIKPRKHPGVMKVGNVELPDKIVKAIEIISEDHPVKAILDDAKMLSNYLFSRHYPWDEEDLIERKEHFTENVKWKLGELPDGASEEQSEHYNSLVQQTVAHLMQKYRYRWSALDLREYSCVVYLFTRAAPNYAAAVRVLHEIRKLCPDYRPISLFDFGSGVGSVSWAVEHWWGKSIKEYMNVDSSTSMNELSSLILQGGDGKRPLPQSVNYREFLPAQHRKYSIVVSAHSLMEMPTRDNRLEVLLNLWNKTTDFFVVIEQGTKPGFRIVLEARDFILSLVSDKKEAHVFAPCPHDDVCPRFLRGPYPCHIQVPYSDLAVGKRQQNKKELISFVIIRKGAREGNAWPRVVRPILMRHNHVICRMCTAKGELKEEIFTKKKHGKGLYKLAKSSNWGDRIPINLPSEENNSNTGINSLADLDNGS